MQEPSIEPVKIRQEYKKYEGESDRLDYIIQKLSEIKERMDAANLRDAELKKKQEEKKQEKKRVAQLELEAGFIPAAVLLGTNPEYLGTFIHITNRNRCLCKTRTPCHVHYLNPSHVVIPEQVEYITIS